jgi:serine/threonine protein kinase
VISSDPLNIIGYALGEYEIVSYRRSGGFGHVYEALHTDTETIVALKILNPSAGWAQIKEFENEGTLLLKMTGASQVVTLLDKGNSIIDVEVMNGGGVRFPMLLRYQVLELADGSLDDLLSDLNELDWPSRIGIFRDIVLGIHQLHLRNIVHRDLKAPNCLLTVAGNSVTAKVGDLGRARDLTQPAAANEYSFGRGDQNFAPPEMLFGAGIDSEISHRCGDLYGIGSVLFELTLGQGITGLSLFPQQATINAHRSLPLNDRRSEYIARIPEIRSWYEPYFELFDTAVHRAIRQPAGRLIRQLCDPDPQERLPLVAPGRRAPRTGELTWLLRRADILRLTLNNDIRQARRLQSRKEKVS